MTQLQQPEKPWWRSRTVWLGLIELTIGLLDVAAESGLTGESVDGVLLTVAGVLTVLFRFLTRQPLARRPRGIDP